MFSQDFSFVLKELTLFYFHGIFSAFGNKIKYYSLIFYFYLFFLSLPPHFLFPSPHSTRKSKERLNMFDSKNLNTSNIFF